MWLFTCSIKNFLPFDLKEGVIMMKIMIKMMIVTMLSWPVIRSLGNSLSMVDQSFLAKC